MKIIPSVFFAISLIASAQAGNPEGVIFYKHSPYSEEKSAQVVEYSQLEEFSYVVNYVPVGKTEKVRVERNKFIGLIRYPDLEAATIGTPDQVNDLKGTLDRLNDAIKRFSKAEKVIEDDRERISAACQLLSQGNVLIAGQWISKDAYEKSRTSRLAVVPELKIGEREYRQVRLVSIDEGDVRLMHAGGVLPIEATELSESQIKELNETGKGVLIPLKARPMSLVETVARSKPVPDKKVLKPVAAVEMNPEAVSQPVPPIKAPEPTIVTRDGREYRDVKFYGVAVTGLLVAHAESADLDRIPVEQLPDDLSAVPEQYHEKISGMLEERRQAELEAKRKADLERARLAKVQAQREASRLAKASVGRQDSDSPQGWPQTSRSNIPIRRESEELSPGDAAAALLLMGIAGALEEKNREEQQEQARRQYWQQQQAQQAAWQRQQDEAASYYSQQRQLEQMARLQQAQQDEWIRQQRLQQEAAERARRQSSLFASPAPSPMPSQPPRVPAFPSQTRNQSSGQPYLVPSGSGGSISRYPNGQTTTTQSFGNGSITRFPNGQTATTQPWGNGSITRLPNGQTATTQPFGNGSVTRYSNGSTSTTQQFGNGTVTRLPDGRTMTTQPFGTGTVTRLPDGRTITSSPFGN